MAETKKLLRKKKDGTGYESFSYDGANTSADPNLSEDTARQMWAKGGFNEVEDAEFEALQRLAYGQPEPKPEPRKPGYATWAEDDFRQGAPKVGRADDYHDAKMDGFSNPAARPDMTAMDGPRNPSPMPRAGLQKPKTAGALQVGMPAAGLQLGAERLQAEATRKPAAPAGLQQPQSRRPETASNLQQPQGLQDPLAAAREESNRGQFGVRLARAGAMANQALTGAKLDSGAWDDLETDSQQPLQDLASRRAMAQEDDQQRRAQEGDNLRAEDTRRRWAADERDFRYRGERDRAEDEIAGRRLSSEEKRAAEQRALQWASLKEQRAGRTSQDEARKEERRAAAEAKEAQMRERQDEKDLAELGKRTDKIAQTAADVRTTNENLALPEGDDVPGAGVWDSFKMESPALRAMFASPKDIESWQSSQRMAASYLNQMSGQSFTPAEAQKTLERYGVRPGATEQEWRSGMTAFVRDVKAGLVQKEAAFKQVVPQFRERGGVTAQDIPEPASASPAPTGRTIRMPDGRVFDVLSNGKARLRGQ
jgi:hypothetical protein